MTIRRTVWRQGESFLTWRRWWEQGATRKAEPKLGAEALLMRQGTCATAANTLP